MDKLVAPLIDLLKWLSGFLWRPVLRIEFDSAHEPYVNFDLEGQKRPTAYYRVVVRNSGRKRAENCEGFLATIERYDLGQRASTDLLGKPERLKWAHEADFTSIEVESGGETRKLDLFYIHEDEPNKLNLFIKPNEFQTGMPDSVDSANYLFKIKIVSSNAGTTTALFSVESSTVFDKVSIKKLRAGGWGKGFVSRSGHPA
jgi:hypothetical protein